MSVQSIAIQSTSNPERVLLPPTARSARRYINYGWLRWIAGLGVVMLLLNCLAVGYARFQRSSNAAAAIGFGWCDGVPCYKNLVPGKTSWAATAGRNMDARDGQSSPYPPVLSPSTDGMWLDTISILFPPDSPVAVGDIVQLYGAPCRVDLSISGNWSSIMLRYPHLDALVSTNQRYLSPDTPVDQISLSGAGDNLVDPSSNPCRLDVLNTIEASGSARRPWHGFMSIHHYLVP